MAKTLTIFARTTLLAVVTVALSSPTFASILCAVPTAISVIGAGGGCVFGSSISNTSATFTNVSIAGSSENAGTPTGAIDPTQVALSIFQSGNNQDGTAFILQVSNLTASNWALTGTQAFDLILTYTVAVGPPGFIAVGNFFNGSGSILLYDETADGVTLPTVTLLNPENPQEAFPGAPLFSLVVINNIQINANKTNAALVSASSGFVLPRVPEPTTSMLLGSGLLVFCVILLRKRG